MNSKPIQILAALMFFWTSGVYSDPKPLGRSSGQKVQQQDGSKADHDLVHRLVQIARDRYEAGNFEAADKILRAALEIEPRNNEAWYYLSLLDETVRANKNSKRVRRWYPTIPPRPVHE